jgi:hypothetical protein
METTMETHAVDAENNNAEVPAAASMPYIFLACINWFTWTLCESHCKTCEPAFLI